MIIYCAKFPSGKCYVGQTIGDFAARKNKHNNDKRDYPFAAAIRKYGRDVVEWSIVDTAKTQAELNRKESEWIAKLNSTVPHGYNLCAGGRNGKHSETTKEKIRAAHIGKPKTAEHCAAMKASHKGFSGRKHTAEARAKMSAWQKGITRKPLSAEHKAKISKTLQGNQNGVGFKHTAESKAKMKGKTPHNKGKSPSAETRAKMSRAAMGRRPWNKKDSAKTIDLPTWAAPVK